jgi:hypothetical protein
MIKVQFLDEHFNSNIPEPRYHLGQPVIVNALEDFDETEYIITGISLNYAPDSQPSWSYCVGDKDESFLDYNFEDAWYRETEISPRKLL